MLSSDLTGRIRSRAADPKAYRVRPGKDKDNANRGDSIHSDLDFYNNTGGDCAFERDGGDSMTIIER